MRLSLMIVCLLWPAVPGAGQTVVKRISSDGSLAGRWAGAARELSDSGVDAAWIGYSIDRLMEEDTWIGSFRTIPDERDISLYELVTGKRITMIRTTDPAVRGRAQKERRLVRKEVALLFELTGAGSTPASARVMHLTNVSLPVELNDRPLYWLGNVGVEESIVFLARHLDNAGDREAKRLVQGIGIHQHPRAFDLLKGILRGGRSASLRKEAAFWISQIDTPAALEVLIKTALGDQSPGVSEQAVFGIGQIRDEAATTALIDLGRTAPRREIRKKAVFWLADRTSRRAVEAIGDFLDHGTDEDVQKQAIVALGQLPDAGGIPQLIRVARSHPNPRVRKQAIFQLGESEDPRAFEAIVAIARGDP